MRYLLITSAFSCVFYILISCHSCENEFFCEKSICMPGNCLYNGQCVQVVGNVCTENNSCLSGICVKGPDKDYGYCTYNCSKDTDCPNNYSCLGSPPMCVFVGDKNRCESDKECGVCGHCISNRCSEEYGCPYSLFMCSTIADCPYCMNCISGLCVPIEGCTGSMCSDNKDCGGCAICVNGLCKNPEGCRYPPCYSDLDCPQGFYCNKNTNECKRKGMGEIGKSCLPDAGFSNGDVLEELICENGICIYDDGNYYCSVECTQDSSICPYNYTCAIYSQGMRVCKKKKAVYTGVSCKKDADCDYNKRESCIFIADSQDSAGSYCSQSFADGVDLGYSCEQHGDCKTNLCPENKVCSKPCERDQDCPRGYICEGLKFDINGNKVSLKGCIARYYTYGRIGDLCNENLSCREGLFCLNDDPNKPSPICTKECLSSEDCIDGYECRKDDLYLTGKMLCLPIMQVRECIYDSDCKNTEVCSLSIDENKLYRISCREGMEGNYPLENCSFITGNPWCKNNMCTYYNYCDKFCKSTSDCGSNVYRCDYSPLKMPDSSLRFTLTCRLRYGSLKSCVTDKDCTAPEICRRFISFDGIYEKNACMLPLPNGQPFGSTCNPQTLEPKCASDLCSDDAICTKYCLSDLDCDHNMKCDVAHSRLSNGSEIYFMGCRPDKKRGGLGDPCPSGWLDCAYNLFCYNDGERSFCTKPCDINNPLDCSPPTNICSEINQNYICVPVGK
ncbi:MAG: hypothetical protein N2746_02175 [Deltaproteobacteria bacterium]|nr:hypothetical protein [Deltaproteobacteria bacterium]